MYAVAKDTAKFDATRSTMCRGLAQQAVRSLMAISSLHRKAPGQVLFAEGDEADAIYEVVRGTVRLCKLLPDGRRLITGFLSAGHLLGFPMNGDCVYTAEAVTEVTVCRFKRAAFERLIGEVPGLARHLLAVASDELRAAQERMLLLGRKSAMEKVASFLVLMAGEHGDEEAKEVAVPMARSDIADYLGLTIETVSRTLTKLKEDEVIALPTLARIEIRDRDRLEELALGETALAGAREAPEFTILLVEDETEIRDSITALLASSGFRVVAAPTAGEALHLLGEHCFDALFTDIVMPDINGIELARAARRLRPDLKVLFLTGYASFTREAEKIGPLLRKPARATQIESELRKLLATGHV